MGDGVVGDDVGKEPIFEGVEKGGGHGDPPRLAENVEQGVEGGERLGAAAAVHGEEGADGEVGFPGGGEALGEDGEGAGGGAGDAGEEGGRAAVVAEAGGEVEGVKGGGGGGGEGGE